MQILCAGIVCKKFTISCDHRLQTLSLALSLLAFVMPSRRNYAFMHSCCYM
jgi:hypothetical protein